MAMLAGKGETPRSARLPQRTAAAEVVLAHGQRLPLAVLVVASGQKELRTVLRQHTARAEGVVVVLRQAQPLLAVAVVVVGAPVALPPVAVYTPVMVVSVVHQVVE